MNRHLMTLFFFIAAMICYASGFVAGFVGLFVAGAVFELGFWFNIFRPSNKDRAD